MEYEVPTLDRSTAAQKHYEADGPPALRPTSFADYPKIKNLEARFLPVGLSEAEWLGLFLDNPSWSQVGDTWPLGWLLENPDGDVVGSIYNIPSLYHWHGRELVCANGRGWVVDPEYRGYALWLMDEYYNQDGVDLFVNTTVAEDVMSVQTEYAIRIPIGNWEQLTFRPTRYRAFAAKFLEIRFPRVAASPLRLLLTLLCAVALRAKDVAVARIPRTSPLLEVAEVQCFDDRFDALWTEIVAARPDVLLARRDQAALTWHYAIPAARGDIRVFTASRNGMLRAYCVFKQHPREFDIRSMRLVDFQTAEPDDDLLSPLLRLALRKFGDDGFHVVEHLGSGLPKTAAFDRVARYRLRHNWSYFYQVIDPVLAAELSGPEAWDPSEYDGDASYA